MLQFGASLTYDTSSVNYDRNMFIIQATGLITLTKKMNKTKRHTHIQTDGQTGQICQNLITFIGKVEKNFKTDKTYVP
jgi:hypothetical protein